MKSTTYQESPSFVLNFLFGKGYLRPGKTPIMKRFCGNMLRILAFKQFRKKSPS